MIHTEIENKHLGTSILISQSSYKSPVPNGNEKLGFIFYKSLFCYFFSNSFLLYIQKFKGKKFWSMMA